MQQQVVSEEQVVRAVHMQLLPSFLVNRSAWAAVVVNLVILTNQMSVVRSRVRFRVRQQSARANQLV